MGSGPSLVCSIRLNTKLNEAQRAKYQREAVIQDILRRTRTIAVVGCSTERAKASNMVASYLLDEGFRVFPVNPSATEILGLPCYPNLASIPEPVDLVDIFRPEPEVPAIVEQAIRIGAKAVWQQLRIMDLASADRALSAGLQAVVDRCVKMEHGRYSGALHWAGMNTEVITARRRA